MVALARPFAVTLLAAVATLVLAAASGPMAAGAQPDQRIEVIVLAGQSNAYRMGAARLLAAFEDQPAKGGEGVRFVVSETTQSATSIRREWAAGLVINEIHYHPTTETLADGTTVDRPEFIEIHNSGDYTIDMHGVRLGDGVTHTLFEPGQVIGPGDYLVGTDDPAMFAEIYGFPADFEYHGSLSNGGERVSLATVTGEILDEVTYGDALPWPTAPDGDGTSLSLISPQLDNGLAASWRPGLGHGGSPASANRFARPGDVDCNGVVEAEDVVATLEYLTGSRPGNGCPTASSPQPSLDVYSADFDANQMVELVDALRMTRCLASPNDSSC